MAQDMQDIRVNLNGTVIWAGTFRPNSNVHLVIETAPGQPDINLFFHVRDVNHLETVVGTFERDRVAGNQASAPEEGNEPGPSSHPHARMLVPGASSAGVHVPQTPRGAHVSWRRRSANQTIMDYVLGPPTTPGTPATSSSSTSTPASVNTTPMTNTPDSSRGPSRKRKRTNGPSEKAKGKRREKD